MRAAPRRRPLPFAFCYWRAVNNPKDWLQFSASSEWPCFWKRRFPSPHCAQSNGLLSSACSKAICAPAPPFAIGRKSADAPDAVSPCGPAGHPAFASATTPMVDSWNADPATLGNGLIGHALSVSTIRARCTSERGALRERAIEPNYSLSAALTFTTVLDLPSATIKPGRHRNVK